MDFRFPKLKEFKTRKCFNCKKTINIGEYLIRNRSINEEKLIQLWESNKIEFYCCLCYDEFIEKKKLKSLKESLNEKEKDILKILELRFSIKIPILSKVEYNSIGATIENGSITGISLIKCLNNFPQEIIELTSLRYLNLSWNSLKSIPPSVSKITLLKELVLIGNELTSLPNEITLLTSLTELDLSFNNISRLPEMIGSLSSLRILNLIHNNLTNLPTSFEKLERKELKILF
jgi:Leucine-rich repeat (LRR) protein